MSDIWKMSDIFANTGGRAIIPRMQAQAVVTVAPRQVELQTVQVPEPTDDDVVLRVTHSWISPGTEGSFIRGERVNGETPRLDNDPYPFPMATGYQKVGVVEWVGKNVKHVEVGETAFATMSKIEGVHGGFGGHVSPAVTPGSQVYALSQGFKNHVAFSGLVLTQVGYNCGARPTVTAGDAAVVIGDGLVGHWSAQTLVARGARVMLVGRHESRLQKFAARPEDARVDSTQQDVLAAVREWAHQQAPEKIQVVVDTVGSVESLDMLIPVMRHNGHLVSAGFHGPRGHMDLQHLRFGELTLHNPSGWAVDRMNTTRDWIASGALQTEPLITNRFPVAKAAEAFGLILNRDQDALGIVLDWP